MSLTFSLLDDSRVVESFAVLERVAGWIQEQGRRQRIAKITLPIYQQWQSERTNYIVTENNQIVGLVTLRHELLEEWPDYMSLGHVPMLRALATHPDHRQKGIGAFATRQAIQRCRQNSPVYLDCVNEFLPGYYTQFGFSIIAEQRRDYAEEGPYDIVLMRKFNSKKQFDQ